MNKSEYEVSDGEMDDRIEELKSLLGITPDDIPDSSSSWERAEEEDECCYDFYVDLKEAAWNILYENPGTEFGDWECMLIEQYPTEVMDALGTNPQEVYASLADMWETEDYEDAATGECHSFRDWAEYFATDRSVELYDLLVGG